MRAFDIGLYRFALFMKADVESGETSGGKKKKRAARMCAHGPFLGTGEPHFLRGMRRYCDWAARTRKVYCAVRLSYCGHGTKGCL
jgi:hypothetical protein